MPPTKNPIFLSLPIRLKRWTPEGVQGATGKPPGRLRRGEILHKTEKARKHLSLASHKELFLVGGFVRLRADEVLSITGKYPKGAGGGQRVHVSWPPPDPPLLSSSAPLASQGRAQLGSHPSLGGPLSPSAQLIPPPAFGRRSVLGVSARDRYGRNILLQYVPRLMCHAKCVPDTDPVGGVRQEEMPLPGQGGSGGIPRPFEGGIGGPGGHRGEVGIPPAPLAGGATLQKKNHFANPKTPFPSPMEPPSPKNRKALDRVQGLSLSPPHLRRF